MHLVRFSCLVAVALLLAACSGRPDPQPGPAGSDLTRIARGKTVRIGVKVDTPPFGYLIGDAHVGFDIDVGHMVAQSLGAEEVVWVPVTSKDRMQKLLRREVDLVIASMTITRSRDAIVDFSIPYFQDGQALLVKDGSPIRSYRDLGGKKVGATAGSTSYKNIRLVAPSAEPVEFDGFDALLAALVDGEVAAITSDSLILRGLAGRAPEGVKLRLAGGTFTTEPYGIALRQNQSVLRDRVNEAIQQMWEDGRYHTIFDTWFGCGTAYEGLETYTITPFPK